MVTSKSAGEVAFVMADMADSIMSVEEVIVVINKLVACLLVVMLWVIGCGGVGVKLKRSHFKASKRKIVRILAILGGQYILTNQREDDDG